jgi:hypothetical protein
MVDPDFGVRRVAEKRPPLEVDQAKVERGEAPGPAAAAAPQQQLVWVGQHRVPCR